LCFKFWDSHLFLKIPQKLGLSIGFGDTKTHRNSVYKRKLPGVRLSFVLAVIWFKYWYFLKIYQNDQFIAEKSIESGVKSLRNHSLIAQINSFAYHSFAAICLMIVNCLKWGPPGQPDQDANLCSPFLRPENTFAPWSGRPSSPAKNGGSI